MFPLNIFIVLLLLYLRTEDSAVAGNACPNESHSLSTDDNDLDLDSIPECSDREDGEEDDTDYTWYREILQIMESLVESSGENNESYDANSTSSEIGASSRPCTFDLPKVVAAFIQLERCTGSNYASLQQVTTDDEDCDSEDMSELHLIELETDPVVKAKMKNLYNKIICLSVCDLLIGK